MMTKKNYNCNECGAPVYLTMIYCDQCGSKLFVDPHRFVCNLAVVSMETENLPFEERSYELNYDTPFNTMEELLKERHLYDDLDKERQESLIYGPHLVYVWYRLGSLKNGLLKVGDAAHYVPVGVRWQRFTKHRVYYFARITNFPEYIKIVD
jgi:DNA-directed RNA polymerase subunit RPC12/RpoP